MCCVANVRPYPAEAGSPGSCFCCCSCDLSPFFAQLRSLSLSVWGLAEEYCCEANDAVLPLLQLACGAHTGATACVKRPNAMNPQTARHAKSLASKRQARQTASRGKDGGLRSGSSHNGTDNLNAAHLTLTDTYFPQD